MRLHVSRSRSDERFQGSEHSVSVLRDVHGVVPHALYQAGQCHVEKGFGELGDYH